MINNSTSVLDNRENSSLTSSQQVAQTSNLLSTKSLSNSNSSMDYQNRVPSNSVLNISSVPMNNNSNNTSGLNQVEKASTESDDKGIFSGLANFFRNLNPWKIEEEEFIDAHGFKCKRPKKKIPLRKKGESYNDEIQKTGGQSVVYATQHSGFGNMFM